MVALLSILSGLDFLIEDYSTRSPALSGPIIVAEILPLPFPGLKIWAILFILGGLLVLLAPTVMWRAVTLILGITSWAIFFGASLWASLLGPLRLSTGSFLPILLLFVVGTFSIAIRNVLLDFHPNSGRIDS